MNANSKQPAQTIKEWLRTAADRLRQAEVPSYRLDSELILAHVLRHDRSWLAVHDDEPLTSADNKEADDYLGRRINREPIAYITGSKEFYGRNFIVTADVLIPRPETETVIEIVKHLPLLERPVIHDVGTGSGCIAITLALELPAAAVTASDYSSDAVQIAQQNAKQLGAKVSIRKDNLLDSHYKSGGLDVIVANLPYVDRSWNVSIEVHHEPSLALYADDDGLALIKKLIEQAMTRLSSGGYLVLEADPRQHNEIIANGHTHGLEWYQTDGFVVVLKKT